MNPSEKEKPGILIVDDEKSIRDMLRRHFLFLGYDVNTANDGKEALDLLARNKCDVVISDIKMPVMDGIQLLKEIDSQFPMTHCIIITGYVSMENLLSCMRYRADTCIFKPFDDLEELENAVEEALSALERWKGKLKTLMTLKPED